MNTGLITKNGAPITVHFGHIVTTNLWNDSWYVITDKTVIDKLKYAQNFIQFKAIRSSYNVDSIGYKYTRKGGPGAQANKNTANQTVNTPAQQLEVDEIEMPADPEPVQEEPVRDMQYELNLRTKRIDVASRLQNFFSEFTFHPANRFLNTLGRQPDQQAAFAYVKNYMAVCNQPDANDISEKIKSIEFTQLIDDLFKVKPDKKINNRVQIYFGDPGTGKTTTAIKENPGAPVFMCNSAITGDDLMQTFDFNDENGHPVFKKSIIREAMENGTPIIMDEINLLNIDALHTLQEITDDKAEINFRGDTVKIKPGFKIIGTMNLLICGQTFGLPEALVDRAECIKEFVMTPEQLVDYAF